ncbi:MAG: ribosomal-protein-serine acetyltransferase, partial [Patescibacteria group bacterium]|nr:ribosomal-protein-serine acetyltransferase [Patescibacteria group bacterium]
MKFILKVDENIEMRLRSLEDLEESFAVTKKNINHLKTFLSWAKDDFSIEDSEKFIIACEEGFAEGKKLDLAIFYDGKMIGSAGFHTIKKDNKMAEIGYWIDEDYEGKGIVSKCVNALVKYGFEELGLNRIQILCATLNKASGAVAVKCGFILEGTLRKDVISNGVVYDSFIYSIISDEYNKS